MHRGFVCRTHINIREDTLILKRILCKPYILKITNEIMLFFKKITEIHT